MTLIGSATRRKLPELRWRQTFSCWTSWARKVWRNGLQRVLSLLQARGIHLHRTLPQDGQNSLLLMHAIILLIILCAQPTFFATLVGAVVSAMGWLIFVWMEGYDLHAAESLPCGPFRFSRHPYLFVGFLVMLGLCLASRAFIPLVALLTIGALWVQRDMRRHDYSQTAMPQHEFLRYRLFVASFLPTLLPYPAHPAAEPFSPRCAFVAEHHRALKWLLLLVMLYGALLIQPSLPHAAVWQWGSAALYFLWMIKHFFFHDLGHKFHYVQRGSP